MLIELADVNLRPINVTQALESLTTVADRLWAVGDHRAVFPEVYAIITREVGWAIQNPRNPIFLEREWLSRLAGRFCEMYLEHLCSSLRATPTSSSAWQIAFEYASDRSVYPAQQALFGISAHINYDLAQGICQNILDFGNAQNPAAIQRYRHDHDQVNQILEAAMPEIFGVLINRYGCSVTDSLTMGNRVPWIVSKVVMRKLRTWRDRVWDDMTELMNARLSGRDQGTLKRMDRNSRHIAYGLAAMNLVSKAVTERVVSRPHLSRH